MSKQAKAARGAGSYPGVAGSGWLTAALQCKLKKFSNLVYVMKTIYFALSFTLMLIVNSTLFAAPEEISKQQAMSIATEAYPGRVLSVKRVNNVYKVKTLSDDGKVRVILIDADSGKILSDN